MVGKERAKFLEEIQTKGKICSSFHVFLLQLIKLKNQHNGNITKHVTPQNVLSYSKHTFFLL